MALYKLVLYDSLEKDRNRYRYRYIDRQTGTTCS